MTSPREHPAGAFPARTGRGNPAEVLRRLELTITHRLDGLLQGNHLGLVPGHGTDLGEARTYQPGDDVRRIDWNVTARMRTPYIRETIADRELETWVVADLSPSLDFGTADCEKRDLALAAVAATAFLTNHTGNRIGGMLLRPGADQVIPPRGGRDHLLSFLHLVSTAEPAPRGTTDLERAIRRLGAITARRGLVVVVSDFLDDGDWPRALAGLAARHEVLAIEVLDPREVELPDVGIVALSDPESGTVIEVDTSDARLRRRFAEVAAEQRAGIAEGIRRAGADHLLLRTDRDWLRDIVTFVGARRRRRALAAQQTAVSP